jgi:hypothetical protein
MGHPGEWPRLVNYGGPGGARVELIPAYNWEVILAPPPYVTASGPKGTGQGTGDWPMFLVKYRLISANKDNGDYIVTAFFQMSDPSGTCCTISNNVGLILGRFQIANDTPTRPVNLIIGAGYQVAVTPNPVTQNNFVGTIRVTF